MSNSSAAQLTAVRGRDPRSAGTWTVYKNLHRVAAGNPEIWSVRAVDGPHRAKVVAYASAIALANCVMHIGAAAQRRIAAGGAREVHAWIIGTLLPDVPDLDDPTVITYHPHKRAEFYRRDTGAAVWSAPLVVFTDAARIAAGPNP